MISGKLLVLSVFAASLCGVSSKPFDGVSFNNPGQIHAVLVSAIDCDERGIQRCLSNYPADAEIAQTYHLLRDHGVPEENIILFMNNRIGNSTKINPFPGTLYTDFNRSRNYNEGLKVDYSGNEVNVNNYLAVLSGNKGKTIGGSGRVLSSTANDRVFVSHEGHGNTGILAIVDEEMTVKELKGALEEANKKKLFKELTYYVMACLGGSMFAGWLPENGNIYALTAANSVQSTYSKDCMRLNDTMLEICFNTQFGSSWLNNAFHSDTKEETLKDQYNIVKPEVINSTVSQYGNLKIAEEKAENFEGPSANKSRVNEKSFSKENWETDNLVEVLHNTDPIAPIAVYLQLKRRLQNSKSFEDTQELTQQLREMEREQTEIQQKVDTIVDSFINDNHKFDTLKLSLQTPPQMITQIDCHHDVVKAIYRECRQITKSPFVYSFTTPMINLCENKFDTREIVAQIQKRCSK